MSNSQRIYPASIIPDVRGIWGILAGMVLVIAVTAGTSYAQQSSTTQSPTAPATGQPASGQKPEVNTGQDPTKLPSTYAVKYEYSNLPGGASQNALKFSTTQGFAGGYLILTAPLQRFSAPGISETGVGDVSVEYIRLIGVIPEARYAHAWGVKLTADSAYRSVLGAGSTVLGPEYIFSKQLTKKVQVLGIAQWNVGISRDPGRPKVNNILIRPFLIFTLPKTSYMNVDVRNVFNLGHSARDFYSMQVLVGKLFAGKYNLSGSYEFPLNGYTNRTLVNGRISTGFAYQF
ncbi:MAG: hypothetical protein MOB07_06475 [Acidobacteria bacterium]|nr:hypothetical protein [Acidobacteriota bacterium]